MTETQKMFAQAKHLISDILPHTLIGISFIMVVSTLFGPLNLEFTVFMIRTGTSLVALVCSYYVGVASLILANGIISRFTHEKRLTQ